MKKTSKKLVVTSLLMASVLPFIGNITEAKADGAKEVKALVKSDLEKAKDELKEAEEKKESLNRDLAQAKDEVKKLQSDKQSLLDKIKNIESEDKEYQEKVDKEKTLKEIDQELEDLGNRIDDATKKVSEASTAFDLAKKNYETERDNNKKQGEKEFVGEDKSKELEEKYNVADALVKDNEKKHAKIQEQVSPKIDQQNKLKEEKNAVNEFFETYEKDNEADKENLAYKKFKQEQTEKYGKNDEKIQQLQTEIDLSANASKSLMENIANDRKNAEEAYKTFRKHKLSLNMNEDYKKANIKEDNIDQAIEDNARKKVEADGELASARQKREDLEREIKGLKDQEINNKKEQYRLEAASKWIESLLEAKTDAFVQEKEAALREANERYKGKLQAVKLKGQTLAKDIENKTNNLRDAWIDENLRKQDADDIIYNAENFKNLKRFIQEKKANNSKENQEKIDRLKNLMDQKSDILSQKSKDLKELGDRDNELRTKKNKLGSVSPDDLRMAKEKLAQNKLEKENTLKEIEQVDEKIKNKNVEKIESDLEACKANINRLTTYIANYGKAKPKKKEEKKDGLKDRIIDLGRVGDGYGISLAKMELVKMDTSRRLKNSYERLKRVYRKSMSAVENSRQYLNRTQNLTSSQRAKLEKLLEKQEKLLKKIQILIEKFERDI